MTTKAKKKRIRDRTKGRAEEARRKTKTKLKTRLASDRVVKETSVESPYAQVIGADAGPDKLSTQRFDKVKRVVSTLDAMLGRGQINTHQFNAARRYNEAFETNHGGIKSALDVSNMGGRAPGSRSTTPDQIWAAGILDEAAKELGRIDGFVVRLIAGEGRSIDDATAVMCGRSQDGRCKAADLRAIGKRLRDALTLLAMKWFGPDKMRRHGAFVPGWARTVITTPDGISEIEMAPNATHVGADSRGVFSVKRGA